MKIRHFKEKVRELLHYNEPSDRLALSFAIGVFIAFTPTLGLHFPTALVLAWMMRLNKLMAILGTAMNNPWTFVPICGSSVWLGLKIWPVANETPINWSNLSFQNLSMLKSYIMPFAIGSIILGVVFAVLSYFVSLHLITRYRTHKIKKLL
ncbi:MAG: DUF2062 domain-containing protein [Nitrospirota bacterium]|nr:DUF2062 domain-containing protein [Nitrospirota bacterium]